MRPISHHNTYSMARLSCECGALFLSRGHGMMIGWQETRRGNMRDGWPWWAWAVLAFDVGVLALAVIGGGPL